nr:hypothetical protein [Rhizobium leguminosarum]
MTEIGRILGSGKVAEVFEYGALALKLYKRAASKASSFREAANLSILERLALPTPNVHAVGEFDGRWGVLMDRAPSSCFADQFVLTAGRAPLEDMAQLHRRLHEKPAKGCRLSWPGFPPGSGEPRGWMLRPESGSCRNSILFRMATGCVTAIFTHGISTGRGRGS